VKAKVRATTSTKLWKLQCDVVEQAEMQSTCKLEAGCPQVPAGDVTEETCENLQNLAECKLEVGLVVTRLSSDRRYRQGRNISRRRRETESHVANLSPKTIAGTVNFQAGFVWCFGEWGMRVRGLVEMRERSCNPGV
jgi:hypothetical protein